MFKSLQDKSMNMTYLLHLNKKGNVGKREGDLQQLWSYVFRERSTSFSLGYLAIQPSAAFGARGRNTLRGEGFAWVPDLGSFFKLLEVGVSPYLSFIPSFKCFENV